MYKLLLLLFIILSLYYYLTYKKILHSSDISIDDVYNYATTGDIVYFIPHKVFPIISYVKPILSHMGMIIVIDNKKYILEIHAKGDNEKLGVNKNGGINFYPLKWRIQKYNRGDIYLSKLNYSKIPSQENIEKFIANIEHYQNKISYNENYKLYTVKNCILHRLCKNCFTLEKTTSMFCTEFIGFCLKELGIIKDYEELNNKYNVYKCILPDEFMFLKQENDYLYNKFYRII